MNLNVQLYFFCVSFTLSEKIEPSDRFGAASSLTTRMTRPPRSYTGSVNFFAPLLWLLPEVAFVPPCEEDVRLLFSVPLAASVPEVGSSDVSALLSGSEPSLVIEEEASGCGSLVPGFTFTPHPAAAAHRTAASKAAEMRRVIVVSFMPIGSFQDRSWAGEGEMPSPARSHGRIQP